MGYFANGSEGDWYEDQYCSKCSHYRDEDGFCPVLDMHRMWNYDAVGKTKNEEKQWALNMFIPIKNDGFNDICVMFVERP